MKDWRQFVMAHGFRAKASHLAVVVGQPVAAVLALRRRSRACTPLKRGLTFPELFTLWHGRAPLDREWPRPTRGPSGRYEWLQNEMALLATMVGRMGVPAIAQTLTTRLRLVTGDAKAERTKTSVQVAINRIGLEARDVLGGIRAPLAAREIGSYSVVHAALRTGRLKSFKVGGNHVIPYAEWARFKSKRPPPPAGYVMLSSIRERLGISSDSKLPEYAALGYIPTAVLCNPKLGSGHSSSTRGTWYVDRRVVAKILADRRAGRAMPWFGKPTLSNLTTTWKLLQERLHPSSCETCAKIWGRKGAPVDFEDYRRRYPPLDFGAKRHLTRVWSPGMRLAEVARHCKVSLYRVQLAVKSGALYATGEGRRRYVTRTDATRWAARKCPTGRSEKSWMTIDTAAKAYTFPAGDLRKMIKQGKLRSRIGSDGAQRGVTYVLRQQLAELRERIGYTRAEAAKRAGVSEAALSRLLRGAQWRGRGRVPLEMLNTVIKRLQSKQGYSLPEAATQLKVSVAWIRARVLDGTVRLTRAAWDNHRPYLTEPMMARLRKARRAAPKTKPLNASWLLLSSAAADAGVSPGTVIKWQQVGRLAPRASPKGRRYHQRAVRTCARDYWAGQRYHRAIPPAWLRGA